MKKLVLIGAVSALALFAGQAFAGGPGGDDPLLGVEVQDIQVPVDHSLAAKDTLNGNSLLSGNSYSDDDSLTADNNALFSNNQDNDNINVTKNYQDNDSFTKNVSFSNSQSWTKNVAIDNSLNVEVDDVMINASIQPLSVGGISASPVTVPVIGLSGTTAKTGDVYGNTFSETRGIYGVNNNTGVAAQANSVSINAKVNR